MTDACSELSGEEKKKCNQKCNRQSKKKAWQGGACTAHGVAPETPATQGKCPTPNVVVGKKCYYVHEVSQTLSYEGGKKWCADTGGEVASIHNNKQNNAVLGLLKGRSSYIGATRSCASQSDCTPWIWDDGSAWVEPKWATDNLNSNGHTYVHSDGNGGETHIVIHSDLKWHDWARGMAIKDVVCQFKNTVAPQAPPVAPPTPVVPAPPAVDAQAECEADWKKACKMTDACSELSGEEKKKCNQKCNRQSKKKAWQGGACTAYVKPVKPMSLPETNCPMPADARACNFWGDPHFTHLFFSDRLFSEILLPGSVVTLQGGNGQKYCADDGDLGVRCNRGAIGGWEKFIVEDAGGGRVALRGGQNNKYCADEDHIGRIICNRDSIGKWEKFSIVDRDDGSLALRGGRSSKFCADEGERTICDRPHIGAWEQFTITVHQKGQEFKVDTAQGTGGRKHRTPKLVNFNPSGLFKLAESEDSKFEAQTFFCPAYRGTTTGVAVAMRFGDDVVQMIRGKATAPESDDPANPKYFTKLSPKERENKFMKFFVNGEPKTWEDLGAARGTRGQDVDDVGGGVRVGNSAFIQQMHTTLETGNSMLPVCVGDGKETIVEVSTPWFDDTRGQRVFESAVTVRMSKPAETGMCGDLPDGLQGDAHRVKPSDSLFTSRQMKSLCDMCRLESDGDTCGAPSREQTAEEVCRFVKADYQAARDECLGDFAGEEDWVEACTMETCVGGPSGTVIAQLELQRELEAVSRE